MLRWIWQAPNWPRFTWQADALAPLLRQVTLAQGALLGRAQGSEPELRTSFTLDALLQNIINSSAIEGESLNVGSVRSSIARRLGAAEGYEAPPDARSEGLAQIMWEATSALDEPLTEARLLQWHAWLFAGELADNSGFLGRKIRVGGWRGPDAMQVVSGRIDRPTVHFEAPPREGLEERIAEFLAWFNASRADATLDPLLRAAIAHFWFVTLHPFDDGNGRLTRALTDLALAQGERQSIRFYAMSVAILAERKAYYAQLEAAQKMQASADPLDLTPWLSWFLHTLLAAMNTASAQIDRVLAKSRFWREPRAQGLSTEQTKVLNRLLDGDQTHTGGRGGFEQGINAGQYQAVAKVSKATATRHLADLVARGCLVKLPGGGRSTRYQILWPSDSPPSPLGGEGLRERASHTTTETP